MFLTVFSAPLYASHARVSLSSTRSSLENFLHSRSIDSMLIWRHGVLFQLSNVVWIMVMWSQTLWIMTSSRRHVLSCLYSGTTTSNSVAEVTIAAISVSISFIFSFSCTQHANQSINQSINQPRFLSRDATESAVMPQYDCPSVRP